MKVDVAIIGAGPAGGMAACKLARTGMKVLLLEGQTLPRHKPCGGAMPASVRDLFDWDISPMLEAEVSGQKVLYNYMQPVTVKETSSSILMVDRSRFDFHLVERAVVLGNGNIVLRDNFRVARIEETAQGVMALGAQGECIHADFLIGADGAFGHTAQHLTLNQGHMQGLAIDTEVEVTSSVFEQERPFATFNFFCIPHGYGWIFPKNGLLSCGVGAWQGRPQLKRYMDDFLDQSFPAGTIRTVKSYGHIIPLYTQHRQIATRRTCLVGDAASLADPIMGEGIRFALLSGALAAEVLATDTDDLRAYQQKIHAGIGQNHQNLYQVAAQIFYCAPEFYYRKFVLGGLHSAFLSSEVMKRKESMTLAPNGYS